MIRKFKVLDIRNNKWDTENTFYISPDGILKIIWVWEEPVDCREFYEAFFSTGLTDKNGVEIYEGDVVKKDNNKILGIIEYDVSYVGFFVRLPKNIAGEILYTKVGCGGNDKLEIIGHIKTHPELLKN